MKSNKSILLPIAWVSALFFFSNQLSAQGVQLKYFGAAGWEITEDTLTILIDPYISRVKLANSSSSSESDTRKAFNRDDVYVSDSTLIDKTIGSADFILVHHSHFDHLSDVPYIAKKTGAKVIATETSCNILRGYGIPDEQLYEVRGGEDYQFEGFSVRVIPSIHSALGNKHYYNSETYTEVQEAPLAIRQFIEGGSLMFLIRLPSQKILTMGSMNYIEREVQGLRPDVLLAGVNFSRNQIYQYTPRLLKATGYPKVVIPTHWDNFRVPYSFSQNEAIEAKVKPFIDEVTLATSQSKVLIPKHLETLIIQ